MPNLRAQEQRINLRASSRQQQLIRAAAVASDKTMTTFILDSAVTQAEKVLADRRYFLLPEAQWTEFNRLLDAPLAATPKLDALLAAPDPRFDLGRG